MNESSDPTLLTGERVLVRTAKHWIAPLADSRWAILILLGALLLAWIQPASTEGIVGFFGRIIELARLGLFLGAIGWIGYNIVAWRTAEYRLTNRRVLCQEGLLRRRSTDTLLTSVTDLRTRVPWLGRMLGYGDLTIMSASGEAGVDTFRSVAGVEAFKRGVLETKTTADFAGIPGPQAVSPAEGAVPAPSPATAAELTATVGELAKLRDAGAITDTEFEEKKASLLARI